MDRQIHYRVLLAAVVLWVASAWSQGTVASDFQYVSPRPGAVYVNRKTTLAFRSSGMIGEESLRGIRITLNGTKSGVHEGSLRLARDQKTIICTPSSPFDAGEVVTVALPAGIQTREGERLRGLSYSFTTSSLREPVARSRTVPKNPAAAARRSSAAITPPVPPATPAGLPDDFPPVRVLRNTVPGADPVFIGNFSWGEVPTTSYISILYRDGTPAFYKKVYGWDFKRQPSGLLTYYDEVTEVFYGMDSAYQVVDSFSCGNGYTTNEHELQVLPDGRAMVMAYDAQFVGMDTVVEGGDPNAMVFGLIIQEIDRDKNVTFEWRSWDYFKITDVTQEDLTLPDIDAVHGNSVMVDADSNIIISSRSLDEVTKISRATGNIIWRMGGKNNEFTLHDPEGWFDHQHTAYRLPNGNLTVFDNGTIRGWSRAVEYAVDESLKVVTKVWEYNAGYNVLGWAMGNVQRLPNGNTMIGWGTANPILSEVTSSGSLVYQIDLRDLEFTYRAYTFPWQTNAFVPAADTVHVRPTAPGDTTRFSLAIANPTIHDIVLTSFRTRSGFFAPDTADSVSLPAGGSITLPLRFHPAGVGTVVDTLELRSEDSAQGIVRRVILRGAGVLSTITMSPSPLHLGTVATDSVVRMELSLTPTTASPVHVDSIRWAGKSLVLSRTAFTVTGPDTLHVIFSSHVAEEVHDTLTFFGDSSRVLVRVPVDATVLGPPPPRTIVASPAGLNFGSMPRDTSVTRTVTLATAPVGTVTVDTILMASSVFAVSKRHFTVTGTDSVQVTCAPHSAGTFRDTLVFVDDSTRVLTRVPLAVTVLAPVMTFHPDSLRFPIVKPGDSTFLHLTLINTSGSAIGIDSISIHGAPFGLFVIVPMTVNGRDSAQVIVRFRPTALVQYRDTMVIFSDAGAYRIAVAGKGGDPLVSTGPDQKLIPSRYELGQNYPNPFNPSTTFTVGLPVASRVSLIMYDALGREVSIISNGVLDAGFHRVTWNAGGLASGWYICRCTAVPTDGNGTTGFTDSRKVLLLR